MTLAGSINAVVLDSTSGSPGSEGGGEGDGGMGQSDGDEGARMDGRMLIAAN